MKTLKICAKKIANKFGKKWFSISEFYHPEVLHELYLEVLNTLTVSQRNNQELIEDIKNEILFDVEYWNGHQKVVDNLYADYVENVFIVKLKL
jgi:hypothetical protein